LLQHSPDERAADRRFSLRERDMGGGIVGIIRSAASGDDRHIGNRNAVQRDGNQPRIEHALNNRLVL